MVIFVNGKGYDEGLGKGYVTEQEWVVIFLTFLLSSWKGTFVRFSHSIFDNPIIKNDWRL